MKTSRKISSLLNSLFWLFFLVTLTIAITDIYNFMDIKSEYDITKKRISDISKEIKQIEKDKNTIARQSSLLRNKQYQIVQYNKDLIEKNINLSNSNMLTSNKISELLKNNDVYILIDTKENVFYVKQRGQILKKTICSVGKGGLLIDKKTGRRWEFVTPRGIFTIKSKTENPVWIKPDWAFIEEKKEIPPPDAIKERTVEGELGKYALDLGFGYKIHGTLREELLGRAVSHGCIRLGAEDLKYIYDIIKINKTIIYVY
jgi:L,D-transpeptidase ErfK/SrfK